MAADDVDAAGSAAAAGRGVEIDARFVLANERTLLAWTRTALALLATGGGVAQFGHRLGHHDLVALAFLAIGIAAAVVGALRFRASDRMVRAGRLPRTGITPYALMGAVAFGGVTLVVAVLAR